MKYLHGVNDDKAIAIVCPKCKKVLLCVSPGANGKIYPYCKMCRTNVIVNLPAASKTAT